MKTKIVPTLGLLCFLVSGNAQAAVIDLQLYDWGLNIDTTITASGDPLPSSVNGGGFNFSTGLGDLTVTIGGAGAHNVDFFVDHEIDELINTFFNETGTSTGSPSSGQSWEIDEPGYFKGGSTGPGDIYTNFQNSALDNGVGINGVTFPDDVSMAMGWDFLLTDLETALVRFSLTDVMPTSGFFLTQTDPDSQASIYFTSALNIRANTIPEPATVLLIGFGLLGLMSLGSMRRSIFQKN